MMVNQKEEEPNTTRYSVLPYHFNNMKKTFIVLSHILFKV